VKIYRGKRNMKSYKSSSQYTILLPFRSIEKRGENGMKMKFGGYEISQRFRRRKNDSPSIIVFWYE
jgi:hypothetical protein